MCCVFLGCDTLSYRNLPRFRNNASPPSLGRSFYKCMFVSRQNYNAVELWRNLYIWGRLSRSYKKSLNNQNFTRLLVHVGMKFGEICWRVHIDLKKSFLNKIQYSTYQLFKKIFLRIIIVFNCRKLQVLAKIDIF